MAQPSHLIVPLNIQLTVTKCAHHRPTHERSDADIRHKVCDQMQHKHVATEWIASHRLETEARNAQEREQIRRNGEVDLLAKMATRLPGPDYDPRRPEDIAMCGGPAPTPARKWILQWRRVVTFDGAHWVSWLPIRGDAQPWFLHQRAVLRASLMDSYRDVLDDLVRQSRHWHSLLRRARVWTTSADQHCQRHNRRIQLFSVMSQLWASERAAHRVESPLPKRQCRTRPGILGQRPPPDMAPCKATKACLS